MSINDNNTNGSRGLSTPVVEAAEPMASPAPSQTRDPAILSGKEEPAPRFATRAGVKGADGISKSKLILLGGGLGRCGSVLCVYGYRRQVSEEAGARQAGVSVSASRTGADNSAQRQRNATDGHPAHAGAGQHQRPARARRHPAHTLIRQWRNHQAICRQTCCCQFSGSGALFRGHTTEVGRSCALRRNSTRRDAANAAEQPEGARPSSSCGAWRRTKLDQRPGSLPMTMAAPRLELTPGTRIQAKLETQISSAVQSPLLWR